MFKLDDTVGNIVTEFPGAAEILKNHRIDFCCGGDRKLKDAAREDLTDKVEAAEILAEINKNYSDKKDYYEEIDDPKNLSQSQLIEYIIDKHHAFLQQTLPQLSELTTKILRAHRKEHGQLLKEVHRLFSTLKMELEEHLIKEEEEIFPLIIEYSQSEETAGSEKTLKGILELETEHDTAGEIIKKLRLITNDYQLPQDACSSFELTYRLLEDLEADLFQHIHLENNILFARLNN
ncbi:iron-sulfur cluster repair di-iron protein [Halanaerobium congolense]|jgi:regulator of cell morphogenesis and NO signaling|uniref:Regulator of cell morphogenesis and NO signaling n=1 Tax=Halanaerobium congolense TaxID=54121 RepID=A0A4R7EN41_9FIRM|nr:iron-sulfur cluster repair di-iron protein [Halanaerobium congolense]TDS34592.1 regulator of cell morphogenesis and NO signaling [Halanaerobium congolense]SDH67804.1 regulator of cell morphogenesis and NO signaling [Halanaerobium congolense]